MDDMEAPKIRTVFMFPKKLVYATLSLVVALVFLTIAVPAKEFRGLDEDEDDALYKKLINRLYFATTTVSTIGYGDITPKSTSLRSLVVVVQLLMLFSIQSGLVEYFDQRIQYTAAMNA